MATGQGILDRLQALKERLEREEAERQPEPAPVEEAVVDDVIRAGAAASHRFVMLGNKAAILNANAALVEKLAASKLLQGEADELGASGARVYVAMRFRSLVEGASVKGMRSVDIGGVGGGSGVVDISSYQLDCMRKVAEVRDRMPSRWLGDFLELAVCRDMWMSLKGLEREEHRIKLLQYCLDQAGVTLGYIDARFMEKRWNATAWAGKKKSMPVVIRTLDAPHRRS